jgi:hypothetical protein
VRQAQELTRRDHQLIAAQGAIIGALCTLAEMRDNETGNHIRRTQSYVRALAERLRPHPRFKIELNDDSIRSLYISAPLHDIGKVGIPDAILRKPGRLTPREWEVMQRHAEYGRDAIERAALELGEEGVFLRYAREIAHGHHERWDGTGYPLGLAGDAIPVSARLMAVADVYDALISRRVYKPPFFPRPGGRDDPRRARIEVLTGLEPVRAARACTPTPRRPNHLAQEVIDNSVDEALAGTPHIDVILHADGSLEVIDDGRGMPVDIHPRRRSAASS